MNVSPMTSPESPRAPGRARASMYRALVYKSVVGRGTRVFTALSAVALAAGVTATLGNLQLSLGHKLQEQLKAFGPNILVAAPEGATLPLAPLMRAGAALHLSLSPELRGQARFLAVGESARRGVEAPLEEVIPSDLRPMRGWWHVQGRWMSGPGDAMVGADLAESLGIQPGATIRFTNSSVPQDAMERTVVGVVSSGSEDDGALFISLGGDRVSGAEARAPGNEAAVEAIAASIRRSVPNGTVSVLQRVARADTLILNRLSEVFGLLGLIIVAASGLCVSTTFATMVNQRSREIGLQKALGATDGEVASFFWVEALVLGFAGTFIGYGAGLAFAAWIGQSVFQAPVSPSPIVFPIVTAIAVGMTLVAAIPSARRIARLEPAITLKGTKIERM